MTLHRTVLQLASFSVFCILFNTAVVCSTSITQACCDRKCAHEKIQSLRKHCVELCLAKTKKDICPICGDISYKGPIPGNVQSVQINCVRKTTGNSTSASIYLSWKPPTVNYSALTGYSVSWSQIPSEYYCECLPKNTTKFTLDECTGGWTYPYSLTIQVSQVPLPTGIFPTTILNPINNCTEEEHSEPVSVHDEPPISSAKVWTAVVATIGGILIAALIGLVYFCLVRCKISVPDDPIEIYAARVYIMYFAQNQVMIDKVASITRWLLQNGVEAILNKMHTTTISRIGDAQWSREQIDKAEKVLIICSSGFINLCHDHDEHRLTSNAKPEELRTLNEIGLLKVEQYNTAHLSRKYVPLMIDVKIKDLPGVLAEYRDQTFNWEESCDQERLLYLLKQVNEYKT